MIIAGLAAWEIDIFENVEVFFPRGLAGTMQGTSKLFFGFVGFDEVCCLSGKTRNPRRTMPWALGGTLFAAASISMLAQLALSVMAPSTHAMSWPLAFELKGWKWAAVLVNVAEVALLPL